MLEIGPGATVKLGARQGDAPTAAIGESFTVLHQPGLTGRFGRDTGRAQRPRTGVIAESDRRRSVSRISAPDRTGRPGDVNPRFDRVSLRLSRQLQSPLSTVSEIDVQSIARDGRRHPVVGRQVLGPLVPQWRCGRRPPLFEDALGRTRSRAYVDWKYVDDPTSPTSRSTSPNATATWSACRRTSPCRLRRADRTVLALQPADAVIHPTTAGTGSTPG